MLDSSIIIVYLIATVGAGLWMARKASGGIDDYFLGGRQLPWWLLGLAGMTMWFDVTGTMVITSFLYMMGPQGLFVEFRGGAVLVLPFLLVFAGKWHRRSGCVTGAEWQIFRFGKGKDAEWARFLSAMVGVIMMVGLMAYLVKGTHLFMGMFFPFSPTTGTLILLGLTTLYTMFSGFYGVVVTDLIQGVIILISSVIVAFMAWTAMGDPAVFAETAQAVTGNSNWLNSAPAWKVDMPPAYEAYESLIIVMFFYLMRNVLAGLGSGAEPRFFGARNDRECGLQCLLQGFVIMLRWPMMIGFAVIGILFVNRELPDQAVVAEASAAIKQSYPDIAKSDWSGQTSFIANNPDEVPAELVPQLRTILGDGWDSKVRLVGYHGTVDPELILPAVLKSEMPNGLRGLLLVAMLAALMSTFDASVNMASGFLIKDVYQRWFRPKASDKEYVRASYVVVLLLVCVSIWMGLMAESINDLWGWIIMGLGSGMAAPGILRLIWWRLNGWGVAASLFLGVGAAIVQRAVWPDLSEWWQFGLMTSISFIAAIVASLLTKPTDAKTLEDFYRKTRPFGLWGPARKKIDKERLALIDRENRTDITAVPFVMLAQVAVFLIAMQLVIKSYDDLLVTLPIFMVGIIGGWWFWWRPLSRLDQMD